MSDSGFDMGLEDVSQAGVYGVGDGDLGGLAAVARDAGLRGQFQSQHFAVRDAAGVAHTRKLADGEPTVLIHHGAFGTHATERRSLALQVAQILVRFLPALDGTAGLVDALQLDQRRGAAPAFARRPQPG